MFIKLLNNSSVAIEAESDGLVGDIKRSLHELTGIPCVEQRLLFEGSIFKAINF